MVSIEHKNNNRKPFCHWYYSSVSISRVHGLALGVRDKAQPPQLTKLIIQRRQKDILPFSWVFFVSSAAMRAFAKSMRVGEGSNGLREGGGLQGGSSVVSRQKKKRKRTTFYFVLYSKQMTKVVSWNLSWRLFDVFWTKCLLKEITWVFFLSWETHYTAISLW